MVQQQVPAPSHREAGSWWAEGSWPREATAAGLSSPSSHPHAHPKPAPPLLPLRIALCSLSGCFLQRCLYVLSHRSHVWWWGAGFICSSFWGRLPCLVVPIPDARSSLGHPPASPPGQGSLGRLSLFHHRSLSVLQAASTGYPGDTEGHVKLGSASLQVYSDPALRPPSTPERGREDSSRLI